MGLSEDNFQGYLCFLGVFLGVSVFLNNSIALIILGFEISYGDASGTILKTPKLASVDSPVKMAVLPLYGKNLQMTGYGKKPLRH